MQTRIRTLVMVLAGILAVGSPGARPAAAADQVSTASAGTVTASPSVVTWGSRQNVGANYTWSFGEHLATSSSATKTYLHAVATTDRVGGQWADNNGPYVGVNYVRGNASGTSWGTPKRLNATSQHGEGVVIAASGKYLYTSWFRITKWINYDPEAPRTLYFRRNTSHGAADSWKARVALTSTSGRVGFPSISAAGTYVYVAFTDSDTGNVRLAVSSDRGVTWSTSTVGTTTSTVDGFEGNPSVAASGSNVVVSWLTDADEDGPSVMARVSIDNGANWDTATTLETASSNVPSSAASGSRIAVAWTTDAGARFSLSTAGTWGTVEDVSGPVGNGRTYTANYGPALAFGGAGQVGIAWAACWNQCDSFEAATRVDLVWAESKDDGATWFDTQVVGSGGGATYRINDAPAVLWPSANKRILGWNGYSLASLNYRMFLRVGTGTN